MSALWESTAAPVLVTAPTTEPVTIAEMRAHEQFADSYTGHDAEFLRLIQAAREQWERDTQTVCCDSRWTVKLDQWWCADDGLKLPFRPVSSIVSIAYLDGDGNSQTWGSGNYTLDTHRVRPTVWYAYNVTTPTLRNVPGPVTVTFQAGHATRAAVPAVWKQAILYLASHWFNNRVPVVQGTTTSEVPLSYERLVAAHMRSSYP